ncbi:hypothetical protein HNV11_08665 [Spirosoma taeanense]|uniref:T9SS type A sorting domain-containing protein n=1 Tax=Spirosoma taeanense TaxID=2735870 RepID=A0A6M5Y6B9_9BACT|nr:hypothetical protein [Spirosoma taeanense]QJW89449.1 hypothetical protein HNV11_08665 [Spirosoma taeanense]
MKTLVASLLIALSASAFAAPATNPTGSASFQSSVYISTTNDLRVAIDKEKSHVVQVRLLDQRGHLIAQESIAKKESQYRARFDIKGLPDGQYQLVITDGTTEEVRQINVATKAPIAKVTRAISIQ